MHNAPWALLQVFLFKGFLSEGECIICADITADTLCHGPHAGIHSTHYMYFLVAEECDELVKNAEPRLERSGVSDSTTGQVQTQGQGLPVRTYPGHHSIVCSP